MSFSPTYGMEAISVAISEAWNARTLNQPRGCHLVDESDVQIERGSSVESVCTFHALHCLDSVATCGERQNVGG